MNKLWVKLSLTFAGVVLAVLLIIGLLVGLENRRIVAGESVPPEVRAYFEEVRNERRPLLDWTVILILIGGVAIFSGAWLSHTLTAPLSDLEQAAEAIGAQKLSQRVTVQGTDEVRAVALRFNEMAERLEQYETLRQNLLADVAHELRNPLHVLRGNLQAILDDVYPLEKKEIARLLEQTDHLTALVDDLHELAQAEARQLPLQKEETDIAQLVKETAASFQPLAKNKEIDLHVELLGTMPQVTVDAARMRQVIHNLLSNGLRHTPAHGQVVVQVEQVEDVLQIRVRDTGTGIASAQLPYVFDRFYRTDSARSRDRGGTGLGLAIVKAIVEAHGGRVTAVSNGANSGSQFNIFLPLT